MGTSALPNILYTPGDEFQTITREDGGIDGTRTAYRYDWTLPVINPIAA